MEIAVIILTLVSLFLVFKVWSLERRLRKSVEMNTEFVGLVHKTISNIFDDLVGIHKSIEEVVDGLKEEENNVSK
jgi:hypothetical protein